MKKLFPFFLLIFLLSFSAKAQNVSGHWYGTGTVDLPGSSNIYMSELILTQKGKLVNGLFNYYFRDSLFSNKVSGTFDASTRKLSIKQMQVIHHSSVSTVNGIDCPMSGEFILRISKVESVLTGIMLSSKDYRFTCPPINFKMKLGNDTTETVEPKEEPKQDTIVAVKPKPVAKEPTAEEKEKFKTYSQRAKNYLKEIEITGNTLKLEFYDNGSIDNDSISVFFNDRLVTSRQKLDYKPISLTINLDEDLEFNELAMFAESVGTIPPNTALLVIYDGSKRYDVLMSCDFDKNAVIKLTKKKEPASKR